MLTERAEDILDLLVREYIQTAEPISSEHIARRMHRGVSPATVRNIFSQLTDEGFIEQPHTSGGRVPKTRAYRFFVDRLLDEDVPQPFIQKMRGLLDDIHTLQDEMARRFHVLSGVLGAAPIGFDELFQEPEFADRQSIRDLGTFLDSLDRYDRALGREDFNIMIGDENDVQPISELTIVMTRTPTGQTFFITGPKRMHYDSVVRTMKVWKTKTKTRT